MTTEEGNLELRRDVLLTFQVALLGMVDPNLRGVTVSWSPEEILGHLYFDGAIGDDEDETASDVEAELIGSLPGHEVTVAAKRADSPTPLNELGLMAWVYRRREDL